MAGKYAHLWHQVESFRVRILPALKSMFRFYAIYSNHAPTPKYNKRRRGYTSAARLVRICNKSRNSTNATNEQTKEHKFFGIRTSERTEATYVRMFDLNVDVSEVRQILINGNCLCSNVQN